MGKFWLRIGWTFTAIFVVGSMFGAMHLVSRLGLSESAFDASISKLDEVCRDNERLRSETEARNHDIGNLVTQMASLNKEIDALRSNLDQCLARNARPTPMSTSRRRHKRTEPPARPRRQ